MEGFIAATVCAIALFVGWVGAHKTVATECEKLGSFYVGSNVYECKPAPEKGQP